MLVMGFLSRCNCDKAELRARSEKKGEPHQPTCALLVDEVALTEQAAGRGAVLVLTAGRGTAPETDTHTEIESKTETDREPDT